MTLRVFPKVALVGRPNVGKSTLFNRLLGYRLSIVEKTPGVTRDRIEGECAWRGKNIKITDTGGVVEGGRHAIEEKVLEQVDEAIRHADLVLFLVDGREGVTAADEAVATRLKIKGGRKPVLLVVNKVDEPEHEALLSEWYTLGFGDPFPVSALHGRGIGDLLDVILDRLGVESKSPLKPLLRFCVAGRPNVGKSSIVNAVLGESRVIVHEEPGTTRDVVDTTFAFEGEILILADTAGLRKRAKATQSLEFYARTRTIRAIRESDVVMLVLEAPEGVMAQDKKIAGEIEEAGKAAVIVANKWDKLPSGGRGAYQTFVEHVRGELPFLHFAPILATSALTGYGIDTLLPCVVQAFRCWEQRLDAEVVKKIFTEAFFISPPPSVKGEKVRMKSIVMFKSAPPTLLLRTTSSAKLPDSYLRFLEGKVREVFDLRGTPLRIKVQTAAAGKKGKRG